MKKFLSLAACLTVIASLAIGGTVAYLTDTDSDVNVMTVGNVQIVQNEQERRADGTLDQFTQNKPLFPTTAKPEKYIDLKREEIPGANGNLNAYKFLADEKGNDIPNVVDKIVTVTNTGRSDAYVRTIMAFEVVADVKEVKSAGTHIGLMRNDSNSRKGEEGDGNSDWAWTWLDDPVEIKGQKYAIATMVHKEIVKPNEQTIPSLLQIYMKSNADNAYVEKLGNTYDVLAVSQAVQVQGFDDAETALDAGFGKVTPENVKTWFADMEIGSPADKNEDNNPPERPYEADAVVSNQEEFNAALQEAVAGTEYVIELKTGTYDITGGGKGKTLVLMGTKDAIIEVKGAGQGEAGGQLDYDLDGATVTFSGVTIKTNNETYAGYARLSATYNNCVIDGHYSLNRDSVFNNCTLNVSGDQYNIWTWGASNAEFNGCTFNCDGKALLLYGTADTNLKVSNCVFNDSDGLVDAGKTAIEIGNDYNKTYTLVVNNAVVNGFEFNTKGIPTNSVLWSNKNSMTPDKLSVTIDGVKVY